jgi:UDP-glucose 4-epimerase
VVVDNLSNSSPEALKRVEKITGTPVPLYEIDCTDSKALASIFRKKPIDAVIHFAGLKAVGESTQQPLKYYRNNIDSILSLCEVMQQQGVKRLIFSSSATVYGEPEELPLKETSRTGLGITNPYGQTKHMIEQILRDLVAADPEWQITLLRYFNPVGAHPSGLIGEDPNGLPNNLLPFICQVAVGKIPELNVFGDDYDTPDGTGIRDYIHVVDLAKGHVAALDHAPKAGEAAVYNLGTGEGASVFEIIKSMEKAVGKTIPYEIAPRRPGDLAICYADPHKAKQELKWHTEKTIQDACADAWRWQSRNPNGFKPNKYKS